MQGKCIKQNVYNQVFKKMIWILPCKERPMNLKAFKLA